MKWEMSPDSFQRSWLQPDQPLSTFRITLSARSDDIPVLHKLQSTLKVIVAGEDWIAARHKLDIDARSLSIYVPYNYFDEHNLTRLFRLQHQRSELRSFMIIEAKSVRILIQIFVSPSLK
jgi:hypothetical protein